MRHTLNIFVQKRRDGSPFYEEVLVEPLGDGRYKLVQSPGLVLDTAADDIFELDDQHRLEMIERGMNLCIQVFHRTKGTELERALARRMITVGGRLDGQTASVIVYTVPVSVGFRRVEEALEVVAEFPDAKWYYGNVYDPEDGVTPLNWWR